MVGNGGEGVEKYGSNGAGTCDDVKGGGLYSAALWEWKLGSDVFDAEGDGGVSP